MPSNIVLNSASTTGANLLTKQVSHDGDTVQVQGVHLVGISGTEDSYTFANINGDATNGLDVDVTRVNGTVTVDLGSNNDITVEGGAVLGTDGNAGPANALSIGGTESGGTFQELRVDSEGHLQVDVLSNVSHAVTNAGTFAVQVDGDALTALQVIDNAVHVDDAAFTLGTDSGVMMMGFAGTQSVNANDAAVLACDTDGALHISDGGNTITVDGTVTANLGATDNAVLDQIETNTSYGDNTGNGTAAGSLRVTVASDSTGVISVDDNGGSLSIDDGGNTITVDGTVTANAGSGTMSVDLGANNDIQGQGAHDAAVTGNPVVTGARATNSIEGITQVANADAVRTAADLNGVTLTRPHTTLEEIISERHIASTSASTALTTFAAGGAGVHNYITTISVANGTGTQALIDISNASASANGIMWTLVCPSSGGNNITFDPPLKQPTANTAIHIKADVSVDAIFVSLNGFQAQG